MKDTKQPKALGIAKTLDALDMGGCAEFVRRQHTEVATRDARIAELEAQLAAPFQQRVQPWLLSCFGSEIAADKAERNHRFLEESLELVQACGCTASEAHQLVDYVFGRPVGEPTQEAGGVMVTLAALCLANDLDMHAAGETELARIWTKVEAIRAKQAAKPKHSPLPQAVEGAGGVTGLRTDHSVDANKMIEKQPYAYTSTCKCGAVVAAIAPEYFGAEELAMEIASWNAKGFAFEAVEAVTEIGIQQCRCAAIAQEGGK